MINTVEFRGEFCRTFKLNEDVVTFGFVIDGVSKSPISPYVNILYLSAV